MKRLALVGVLLLGAAGCGWSPFPPVQVGPQVNRGPPPHVMVTSHQVRSPKTFPASAATRAAVSRLMHSEVAGHGLPKGVKLRVVSVRVAASDPRYARAVVALRGGAFGRGNGDEAAAVAINRGGQWSILVGPGTGFPDICRRRGVLAVHQLLCYGHRFSR